MPVPIDRTGILVGPHQPIQGRDSHETLKKRFSAYIVVIVTHPRTIHQEQKRVRTSLAIAIRTAADASTPMVRVPGRIGELPRSRPSGNLDCYRPLH